MKVVLSWLREFCPTDLPADELADLLTGVGVKVEEVLRPWEGLSGVIAARVLEVSDHPDSDKLCVTRVDTGAGEAVVAAGVRNMQAGDLVPYAPPGSRVPVLAEPLAVKSLRGVESHGMLCSPRELNVADVHTGIMILPASTPVGADIARTLGLSDAVLDIEIEPNRPDLMSVIGVAREAAAVTGVPLELPKAAPAESGADASAAARIEIRDLEGCPQYLARIIRGVRLGDTPVEAQARLWAAGMRPISNVVDATNYALLEIGHPLHPFDLALLEDATIVVRRAQEGERLETLDGVERSFTLEDLVIADAAKGVAVAGVMGSAAAEVSEATTDVLLESAYFAPTGILRTARRLGLSTEASQRFERGADPEAPRRAVDRASALIVEWSGGAVAPGVLAEGSEPERRHVSVRPSRAAAMLGEPAVADQAEVIRRLEVAGFAAAATTADAVDAEVPGFRVDVEREIDLIEELARIEGGYERVAATLPAVRQAGGFPEGYAFARRIRELLVRAGCLETKSLSFASAADLEFMGDDPAMAVRVANPLTADEGYLRTRLSPGLLRTLRHNRSRLAPTTAIFEIGTTFRAGTPVDEIAKVGFALTGSAGDGWADEARPLDLFDAKGTFEALLDGLGIEAWSLEAPAPEPMHPGRSAAVSIAGVHAGVLGELHPRAVAAFELTGRVALCVLSLRVLSDAASSREWRYANVPRFPPLRRDLAFAVGREVAVGDLVTAIEASGGELLDSVRLFDVFEGEAIGADRRSLAFAVEFRAADRTLTDEEADAAVGAINERLSSDFGAELRAG